MDTAISIKNRAKHGKNCPQLRTYIYKKTQGNRSYSVQTNTHYVPRFKITTAEAEARGSL